MDKSLTFQDIFKKKFHTSRSFWKNTHFTSSYMSDNNSHCSILYFLYI